jgi:hypothetical protein
MAFGFSQGDILRIKQRYDRLAAKAKTNQASQAEMVNTVVTASEVSASAFLFGLAQGKWGGIAIMGVPADLIAGVGLHVLGFSGVAGKQSSPHLHAFADGALASFFTGLGRQVGVSIQSPEDKARIAKSASAGEIAGVTGGASLADEELARMVAATR